MRRLIKRRRGPSPGDYKNGYILLRQPFFFKGGDRVPSPGDRSPNIVHLEGGQTVELSANCLWAFLLWVLWCALHSTMIAKRLTDYLRRRLGNHYRFYRLFFNIVAFVTLIPLVLYSISIKQAPIFRWEGPLVIVKYLLLVTSIGLFVAGARHYSLAQFLGIRQVKTGRINPGLSEYETFDTSGILSAMRHPWYTAGIMILWARDLSLSALLNNIVISAYFVIGAILEERKLLSEFGERYQEYQRNVSMFIPYKWFEAKVTRAR